MINITQRDLFQQANSTQKGQLRQLNICQTEVFVNLSINFCFLYHFQI